VEGVTIHASVYQNNRPVVGLTAEDFVVLDEGMPQHIRALSVEVLPTDVTVVLDLSSSVDGRMLQRLKTAVDDTVRLLRPEDRIRLLSVSHVVHEIFTFRPRSAVTPLDRLSGEGATSLYDALSAAMMSSGPIGRRHFIVAFTDGHDSTSIIDVGTAVEIARGTDAVVVLIVPSPSPTPELRRLAQPTGSLDPSVGVGNVVAGRQPTDASLSREDSRAPLKELVEPTGGRLVSLEPGESVSRTFKAALEEFRSAYVLQYTPSGVPQVGWHDVVITVKKRGTFEVRARRGYLTPGVPSIRSMEKLR
jgi:VWFA-related protein